ncbi:hypothetical protein [Kitasatospora sp. NPDC093102]|uniref:hypothetical protein n=1 Tax=Kitasatospora sp. NPDC093102 TaxID=3155069 RepID=UPI0034131C18
MFKGRRYARPDEERQQWTLEPTEWLRRAQAAGLARLADGTAAAQAPVRPAPAAVPVPEQPARWRSR